MLLQPLQQHFEPIHRIHIQKITNQLIMLRAAWPRRIPPKIEGLPKPQLLRHPKINSIESAGPGLPDVDGVLFRVRARIASREISFGRAFSQTGYPL